MPSSPLDPAGRSLTEARWVLAEPDASADALGPWPPHLLPPTRRVMQLRGFAPDAPWLRPDLHHLHDPFEMLGMQAAVDRLRQAFAHGERIRLVTDYDVDGTTSSLILLAALRLAHKGVQVDVHIPDRFDEGYGFSPFAAKKAAEDGIQLIVTADVGVRDHAAIGVAAEAGIDVIVADHHLPGGASVPEQALVLCPPQADCTYPNPHLAACGVATKLATALLADHPARDRVVRSLLKLAAIGTVADLVPLTTLENRAIVYWGLRALNEDRHNPGLSALLKVSGLEPGTIGASDLGFRVGPRINAAGRIDKATRVVELLSCRDPARAASLAEELDQLNSERRAIQQRLVDKGLAQLPTELPGFVVLSGPEDEGWHRGVVGIVAARIKETTHRPTAVVSIQGDKAVGSVRSIPGLHAVHALDSVADLLEKYGGHPAAAGFTVPTASLPVLAERLHAWVETHADPETLIKLHTADAGVPPEALNRQLFSQLEALGPFGQGNRRPTLWVRGAQLDRVRTMGKGDAHLKATLRGRMGVDVVWWRMGHLAQTLAEGPHDLLGTLTENRWRGRSTLQFVVDDARPADPSR